MAVKSSGGMSQKQKESAMNLRRKRDSIPDEIALRDEILELKRQIMVLKRTIEQNAIKFRKYEDEAKRKDRQIEQLMDPRKNTEITKILSTKGAAILMNLKDQNNSLIQMILTKDAQIRRLVAEIKTAKLYGGPRKAEVHKPEVIRLKNVFTAKSQDMHQENVEMGENKGKEPYANGNSEFSDLSPRSVQFSPREIEELRFTIQTLETHIEYSNNLLDKKNQQILILTDELNKLKMSLQRNLNKGRGSIEHDSVYNDAWNREEDGEMIPVSRKGNESTSANEAILNLIEKAAVQIGGDDVSEMLQSAPATQNSNRNSENSTPKRKVSPFGFDDSDIGSVKMSEISIDVTKDDEETNGGTATLQRPLQTFTVRKSTGREGKTEQPSVGCRERQKIREKWKTAAAKAREQRKQEELLKRKFETGNEKSDSEIREFEMLEKEIQGEDFCCCEEEKLKYVDTNRVPICGSGEKSRNNGGKRNVVINIGINNSMRREKNFQKVDSHGDYAHSGANLTSPRHPKDGEPANMQTESEGEEKEKSVSAFKSIEEKNTENFEGDDLRPNGDPEEAKKWNFPGNSNITRATFFGKNNSDCRENFNAGIRRRRETFRTQYSDSSYESDCGNANRREPRFVQVEVEINPIPDGMAEGRCDDDDRFSVIESGEKLSTQGENYFTDDFSKGGDEEISQKHEEKEVSKIMEINDVDDDDDDVIVR